MVQFTKISAVVAALAGLAFLLLPTAAPAISADLAKKCRELAIKAHPPAMAGSKSGTGQAERDYFRSCVAKGGNVGDDNPKK